MSNYTEIEFHYTSLIKNEAFNEWDLMSDSEKQIYADRFEYAEVRYRESIHRLAVEKGLMK